jgi:long-chain acyl-CoA synthetase
MVQGVALKKSLNIYSVISEENSARLGKTAVVYRGIKTTYGALLKQAVETASILTSCGIRADDRIALGCPDSTSHIVLALALLKIGAVQIPVSFTLPGSEVKDICEQVSADALISTATLPDGWQVTREMQQFTCAGDEIILQKFAVRSPIVLGLSELNPAFIRFTSGTTSSSKGVIISHESVICRTDSANAGLKISSNDTVLWVLAMAYHFVVTILLFLRNGAAIVICESPAVLSMAQLLRSEKITLLYMSPFHYYLMCESSAFNAAMLEHTRLAVTTAMPMDRDLAEKFHAKFNIRPRQAYGIIEAGLPCIDLDEKDFKPGVVGRPLPSCELRIKEPDENGVGIIMLRSPGMFDGYLCPFRRREDICENGFFNTGDLGVIDESGQLVIVGRSKNIINFAGMKIFPYEIEEVLRSFPAVEDVSVYPVKDALYGEKPQADIVFKADAGSHDELLIELRKFCYANLAPYKVPKGFNICATLEHTASGKILRRNQR